MFESLKKSGGAGFIHRGLVLLLLASLQLSMPLRAQEVGGDNVLTGKTDLSGISLGGGMSTDVSTVADICANTLDKAACTKKLTDSQLKKMQVMQGGNPLPQDTLISRLS